VLLRLLVTAVFAFGMVGSPSAQAQTQPQIQTLGSPGGMGEAGGSGRGFVPANPKKPTAAEKKAKRAACLEQAKQQNLTGKARSTFVKNCTTAG
jgi:hypothetical protein